MRPNLKKGRKREEGFGELENEERKKEGLTTGGEERGRGGWGAWKCGTSQTMTHHLEGRKREEQVGELGNMACHKRGLTHWRGGRGRSRLVSSEMWHVTNKDSPTEREEEEGAGWREKKRCYNQQA